MDISAFSEDNFDVRDWINKTFRSVETQENKEVFVSSMVTKLQLYVQQVNSALEETSQQVLQNLPRVMHDADMIHKEALMLKDKMKSVKEEITKIERDTGESMAVLEKLDMMKTELQMAKQSLHEADNWTVLATDIEEVFESHDIDAIACKVVSMQQSLRVLASCVDYEDRRLQLEGFKNRLEAIASPHLVKAFTNTNINESKKYVTIFSSMNRLPELIKYYAKCQKGLLCQQWRSIIDVDQDHGVSEWLKAFYDILLLNWQTQVKWCQEVFGNWEMLPKVYAEALASMDPSLSSCIETALKQQTEQLPFLIQLKNLTHNFANNLVNALQQQGGVDKETWRRVCQALYLPYMKYVSNYKELEERHSLQELGEGKALVASGNGDLVDSVQCLGQSAPTVLSVCRQAHTRCIEFTHATAYPALVATIQNCLLKYLDQYKSALRQIDLEKQNKDEWTMFRVCLTLLQSAGDLLLEVEQLDRDLVQGIMSYLKNTKSQDVDMKGFLLTKSAQDDYNSFLNYLLDSGDDASVLENVMKRLGEVCYRAYKSMFDTMFSPISTQLDNAKIAWATQSNIAHLQPEYSYAPLEYITQIGEYMMTLPQHLEPFVLRENPGLSRALLATSKTEPESSLSPADLLLGAVAKHTCSSYTDLILNIHQISTHGAKQLSIDIGYLGNVLEDLGFSLSDNLSQLLTLLKLPADNFQTHSTGCSAKLVATVRNMRNITSS